MKISAYLLCLMVGGSFALPERCDFSKCKEFNIIHDLQEDRFLPNAHRLREYCPKVQRFLECNIDAVETCTGQNINELAASSDRSAAREPAALLGVQSLVRDLCNPHSTLHKNYVANVECFRGFAIVGSSLCNLEAKETLEDFYEKSNIEKDGLDESLNAQIRCLELGYETTCISIRLGESCGESARSAFVTAVQRLKDIWGSQCEGGSNDLKTKFFNYMEIDDEQMKKIKETFDLFRKR